MVQSTPIKFNGACYFQATKINYFNVYMALDATNTIEPTIFTYALQRLSGNQIIP